MSWKILEGTLEDIISLRKKIFYPYDEDDTSYYLKEDKDTDAIHLILKIDGKKAGVASILPDARILPNGEFALWRLQYLGIKPKYQNKGHGKRFIKDIINFIYMNDLIPCWFSAPEYLKPLYEMYKAETISEPHLNTNNTLEIDMYLNYK